MHRFYVPPAELRSPRFVLPEMESKHAVQVLRLQAGERLQVIDGVGNRYDCQIVNADRRAVTVEVQSQSFAAFPAVPVEVFAPLAKGKAMDFIIQKATELGAMKITAVSTERCVAQVDAKDAEDKVDKWRQIAIEASKQSGREWLPEIPLPVSLKNSINHRENGSLDLIAALLPGARPIRQQFNAYAMKHGKQPQRVGIWVGPEGDFSPTEYEFLLNAGLFPINLGSHVLRCETAIIALLAGCQQEILWLQSNSSQSPL